MAPSFTGAWRSFWHTMTSYDRHASHDSPHRTGQHNSFPENRHAQLTSISTNAGESRLDLTTQESSGVDTAYSGAGASMGGQSPLMPYSPGMRSAQHLQPTDDGKPQTQSQSGGIPMQNFSEGLPPPPPPSHSWKRIDRWTETNYEELFDNISEGCTQNDVNELEHDLDCTLPMDVRESLRIHDGQERGGLPTGVIFGCMLLDCEEIVQEWKNWRTVNEQYLSKDASLQISQVPKAFAGPSSSSNSTTGAAQQPTNSTWREELQAKQDSQPANFVQRAYAHPAWIPLARDWGGNCLAIDLAPGPAGKWGQVILMGRDYDCKYVVARCWAALLATVADDISSTKVFVHEETGELKLREFKQEGIEPAYLDILRWRTDQKYGRKLPPRRPEDNLRAKPNGHAGKNRNSPYSNPGASEDRGRSPQRPSGKGADKRNPRGQISSPLARVAEEVPAAIKVHTNSVSNISRPVQIENLISPDTPRASQDARAANLPELAVQSSAESEANKENGRPVGTTMGLGVKNVDLDGAADAHDDMKTVEI